jgi:TonB-linked SusC/RagA family outer membrane protein
MSYRRVRGLFVALYSFLPAALAAQATGTVRGRVVDAASQQQLAGVQVVIEGTRLGALTQQNGEYVITSVPAGPQTLVARRIGYALARQAVTVLAGESVTADFRLGASATTLSEVVVTGTAAPTARRALGNTIETVAGTEVAESPAATSIDQALQGRITGAVISENSGQPGGGVSIRLRGTNSILGGAEPLYVIDGVIVDNNSEALVSLGGNATRGGAALSNRLADLDPADVERVEVLKGAAAAALYGSRANNGVIQIFTKRGRAGTARVTFSSEYGTGRTPARYELVEIPQASFADVAIGAAARVGDAVGRFDAQDQIFRTARSSTNRLSVSGGGEATTFFLGGSYQNEQGILRNSDYNRLSMRANLTQRISSKLEVAVRGNFVSSGANFIPEGEQTQGVLTGVIFTPSSFDASFDTVTGRYPANPVLTTNALEVLNRYEAPEDVTRFVGGIEGTFQPMNSLTVRYLAGIDDYRREVRYLQPPRTQGPNFTGLVQNPVQFARQFNNDIALTHVWAPSTGIGLSTGLGFRYTSDQRETVTATAGDLPPEQTLVGGATQTASQAQSEIRTIGGYLEERLSWNDRLYLTGGVNVDASSAFGSEERVQFFPRVGLSYVVSETPTAGGLLSSLRLRAAYGQTGGQPPGAYTRFVNYIGTSFAGRPGLVGSTIAGNPNLKPERQREYEGGLEAAFLGDRAQLDFTYYDKLTHDLVLSVPLNPSSGALSQFQNIGELTNKGVEVALNALLLNNPGFTWRSRLSYAANRNRVIRLAASSDSLLTGYLNYVIEGQPVGVFYGGVYARDAQGAIAYDAAGLALRGRDTLTINGVTTTPFANRIIGDPNPDFTLNFSNSFELPANVSVSVLFDGRFGNDVANFTRRISEFFGSDKIIEREIRGDTVPRTFGRNPNGRISVYEEYIEDGSFVKLREISIQKTFDETFVRGLGVRNIVLRLAGRNLFTWTDYRGLDPEINLFSAQTVARGVDFATTPLPRQFVAGATINF